MKFEYFGDSYDIVKRHLIASLRPMGSWAIHPMLTEIPSSEFEEDFSTFLGAPLLSIEVLKNNTDRMTYFASCKEQQNLLLDPNTGLKLQAARRGLTDYLFASDLVGIVNARSGEVLTVVYDQSLSRGNACKELEDKLERLRAEGLHGFAYQSHACFLFVSKELATVGRARELLFGRGKLPYNRIVPRFQD